MSFRVYISAISQIYVHFLFHPHRLNVAKKRILGILPMEICTKIYIVQSELARMCYGSHCFPVVSDISESEIIRS